MKSNQILEFLKNESAEKYLDGAFYEGDELIEYIKDEASNEGIDIGGIELAGGDKYINDIELGYGIFQVLYFKDHDVYIKFDGYYQSYLGTELESISIVRPQQKTITIFN